ncbi:MAG: phosphate ABC transporter permease subunit PstC [Cyanobacteria bacterium]|nr:phosphate ABC transporter permease subunit PstC [Cyanobacteriota bacterium]MDW8202979.1 phosphate ABC transporter permease subunit PstC [Cyanobacteriota bacterium SKYGB_h_bin112]
MVSPAAPRRSFEFKASRNIVGKVIEIILFLAASISVVTTIAIVVDLIYESIPFFQVAGLWQFLTGREWGPVFEPPKYGILPLVSGTLTTTIVALLLAIPMGTIIAMYLSEFAPAQVREIVKPILELLAGVPTVVYGYFALLVVTPALQLVLKDLPGFNMLSAGLVIGIMIVPTISSISEDAMRAVPVSLREGSYATGATRLQTALRVVFPAAISGISSSYILGISRAVGETMVVAVAAGLQYRLTFNPAESAATITAYIVQVSIGDLPYGSIPYQSVFAAGLVLVFMTLVLNVIGHFLSKRYREIY